MLVAMSLIRENRGKISATWRNFPHDSLMYLTVKKKKKFNDLTHMSRYYLASLSLHSLSHQL